MNERDYLKIPQNSSNNVWTIPKQRLTSDLDHERPRLLEGSESSADQDFGA